MIGTGNYATNVCENAYLEIFFCLRFKWKRWIKEESGSTGKWKGRRKKILNVHITELEEQVNTLEEVYKQKVTEVSNLTKTFERLHAD